MTTPTLSEFAGARAQITAYEWAAPDPRYLVLLLHGFGEHLGRYQHVADALVAHGATVVGPDHLGHGRSGGERVLIERVEDLLEDAHAVWERAHERHPGLPTVLIGHSMGGHLGARHALEHRDELAAVVLSAPVIGKIDIVDATLTLPEIPDVPLPPEALSRDPAVGAAYAADPLVWHGGFARATLESFSVSNRRILESGSLGDLPLLWVHGTSDPLIPREDARVGVDAIAGDIREDRSYEGGMHESFNEVDSTDVIDDVVDFIERHVLDGGRAPR